MGVAEIKAMRKTLEDMKEIQRKTSLNISNDIDAKRKDALIEIRKYLDEVAEALDGMEMIVRFNKGEVFDPYCDGQRICFNSRYPVNNRHDWSKDEYKPWFILSYEGYKKDDENCHNFIDSTNVSIKEDGKWAEGFILLIENWEILKATIESGIKEELNKAYTETKEKTEKERVSYEKVDNFKV